MGWKQRLACLASAQATADTSSATWYGPVAGRGSRRAGIAKLSPGGSPYRVAPRRRPHGTGQLPSAVPPSVGDLVDGFRVGALRVVPDAEGQVAEHDLPVDQLGEEDHPEATDRRWQVDLETAPQIGPVARLVSQGRSSPRGTPSRSYSARAASAASWPEGPARSRSAVHHSSSKSAGKRTSFPATV
jgi:hypothetical protein